MKKNLYIIFGPPGSNKTAQAHFLEKQLNLAHISWGTISRSEYFQKKYHRLFRIIENVHTSDLNRSKLIAKILAQEIKALSKKQKVKGIILDGFPRREEEAKELLNLSKRFNLKIKSLIRINPSLERATQRIRTRLICGRCRRYYIPSDSVGLGMTCEDDHGELVKSKFNKKEIVKDFLSYTREAEGAFSFLKKYADIFFDVSGDEDDLTVRSNILLRLSQGIRNYPLFYVRTSESTIMTRFGAFRLISYQSQIDYTYHLLLIKGSIQNKENVLTRVHSSCMTGDIFGSQLCDCGGQLHFALRKIAAEGSGLLIYLMQEGRGINIINKLKAYSLQRSGMDTVIANETLGFPAEMRDYLPVKNILDDLSVKSVRLMTNNPDKIKKLTDLGIVITEAVDHEVRPSSFNRRYLRIKAKKMGHKLRRI